MAPVVSTTMPVSGAPLHALSPFSAFAGKAASTEKKATGRMKDLMRGSLGSVNGRNG